MREPVAITIAAVMLAGLPGGALAVDELEGYRIEGAEIGSVVLQEKDYPEDPNVLVISLVSGEELVIESDSSLTSCAEELKSVAGSGLQYVNVVSLVNAQTMNGVLVVSCQMEKLE